MLNWYAVQTRPRQQAVAELNLVGECYNVYLSRILPRKRRRREWCRLDEKSQGQALVVKGPVGGE